MKVIGQIKLLDRLIMVFKAQSTFVKKKKKKPIEHRNKHISNAFNSKKTLNFLLFNLTAGNSLIKPNKIKHKKYRPNNKVCIKYSFPLLSSLYIK